MANKLNEVAIQQLFDQATGWDKQRVSLYSTKVFSSGAVAVGVKKEFFQTPAGQETYNQLDTCLEIAGQFPYAYGSVVGIRAVIQSRTTSPILAGDLQAIASCCLLEYKKSNRMIIQVPVGFVPAGQGLFGQTSEATTTLASNGNPVQDMYKIYPEVYMQNDPLSLTITCYKGFSLTADVDLTIILETDTIKKYM